MAAAAPNLTPVTLELGGKAPAVVCPDFPLDRAAARIATGKWFNAGQTCIGVDYVLVDEARTGAFVEALQSELRRRYPDFQSTRDYTRIINDAQYARLRGYVDDARARGVTAIEPLTATLDPAARTRMEHERLFPPTLLLEPPADSEAMRNEIFGPILPVLSYRNLDEAIARIRSMDRPLALYPFSDDAHNVEKIIDAALAGGVTVNDTLLHFGAHDLPFGGIGPSGIGAIHGRTGFDTFSKLLPVFRQRRFAGSDLLKPPYRGFVDRMVRLLSK
jgi:coniferyl-aldehyde dehydrogenase